jgi:hypothetical protein
MNVDADEVATQVCDEMAELSLQPGIAPDVIVLINGVTHPVSACAQSDPRACVKVSLSSVAVYFSNEHNPAVSIQCLPVSSQLNLSIDACRSGI